MIIDREIVSIDVEATGTDPTADAIVQIAAVTIFPVEAGACLGQGSYMAKIKPWKEIPQEAIDIHGITNESVVTCPTFADEAPTFLERIRNAKVIVGYNLFRFDLLIIAAELERAGITEPFPNPDALVLDACTIFHKKEPRNLEAAIKKFCHREHSDAHDAESDARGTLDVLFGQVDHYPDLKMLDWDALAKFARPDDMVDFAGKLRLNSNGEVCYNIGQNGTRGTPVKQDLSMAEWMLSKNFPADTCRHLRRLMAEAHDEYVDGKNSAPFEE